MTKRVLSIVNTAYRATVEEQDDTVLWLSSMCGSAGLELALLLRGNSVNYAVRGHDASGLRFGDLGLEHSAVLDRDIADLVTKGIAVHYVAEDAADRGIGESQLVSGVKPVGRSELPDLFSEFDQVWNW